MIKQTVKIKTYGGSGHAGRAGMRKPSGPRIVLRAPKIKVKNGNRKA